MQSDVVEDDGEIAVRMSTGNWYILRQDPGDGRAFILEGGFGDRYRLQTDKPVRSLRKLRLSIHKLRGQPRCSPGSVVSGMQPAEQHHGRRVSVPERVCCMLQCGRRMLGPSCLVFVCRSGASV